MLGGRSSDDGVELVRKATAVQNVNEGVDDEADVEPPERVWGLGHGGVSTVPDSTACAIWLRIQVPSPPNAVSLPA